MPKLDLQTVWSTFASVAWAEPLPQLIQAIANKQRQHILQLVSWAYSSIQPERLAALTGISSADVLQRMFLWLCFMIVHDRLFMIVHDRFEWDSD